MLCQNILSDFRCSVFEIKKIQAFLYASRRKRALFFESRKSKAATESDKES